jgi:hypothetical protein
MYHKISPQPGVVCFLGVELTAVTAWASRLVKSIQCHQIKPYYYSIHSDDSRVLWCGSFSILDLLLSKYLIFATGSAHTG